MSCAVLTVREVPDTPYSAARPATRNSRAEPREHACVDTTAVSVHEAADPTASRSSHAHGDATAANPLHDCPGAGVALPLHALTDAAAAAAESDAVAQLGDEIATLSAHIHAATHRLLVLIADFDLLRGWELDGQRSCAHWLAFRTGIDLGAAREKVRAAHALERLPLTSAAMSRGELSFSQVRAHTRVTTGHRERAARAGEWRHDRAAGAHGARVE
ncbi:MAG TPA: hypothetical protein VMN60_01895 [Longimicrobiales bacterium]|nr:hypothetical protein [Longimicrobiales bacterium]